MRAALVLLVTGVAAWAWASLLRALRRVRPAIHGNEATMDSNNKGAT